MEKQTEFDTLLKFITAHDSADNATTFDELMDQVEPLSREHDLYLASLKTDDEVFNSIEGDELIYFTNVTHGGFHFNICFESIGSFQHRIRPQTHIH